MSSPQTYTDQTLFVEQAEGSGARYSLFLLCFGSPPGPRGDIWFGSCFCVPSALNPHCLFEDKL